eukprot:6894756-Prymnesium_polylepis.1
MVLGGRALDDGECPFRLFDARNRCFADVRRFSNAQETPRKQLKPTGTKLATVRAAGATARPYGDAFCFSAFHTPVRTSHR